MSGGQWKSGVALCVATLAGTAIAFLLMPRVFARIETDLERTKFLLKTVKEVKQGTTPAPEIVVLGNSVTMNGVDTALLSEQMASHPRIYNFSSTGQSIAEGYLYLQELPKETNSVVLVVSPGNLEDDGLPAKDVYNTFNRQGYRPTAQTVQTLTDVFKNAVDPKDPRGKKYDVTLFTQNEIQERFHSRWVIAQMPDTEFRKKIRKDLETSKSIKSLTYPAPYSKPIPKASFEKLLPTYNEPRKSDKFSPLPTQIELIAKMAEQLRAENRKFYIVLAPMHPRRLSFAGAEFVRSLNEWAESDAFKTPVLNLSEILKDDQFLDVVHPSRQGAEVISKGIAEFLIAGGAS